MQRGDGGSWCHAVWPEHGEQITAVGGVQGSWCRPVAVAATALPQPRVYLPNADVNGDKATVVVVVIFIKWNEVHGDEERERCESIHICVGKQETFRLELILVRNGNTSQMDWSRFSKLW